MENKHLNSSNYICRKYQSLYDIMIYYIKNIFNFKSPFINLNIGLLILILSVCFNNIFNELLIYKLSNFPAKEIYDKMAKKK